MPDLVRNDVGLGELSGRAEAPAQFIEEAQIQVHFFIFRAVERSDSVFRHAAGGRIGITEEHEMSVAVRAVCFCGEHVVPVLLHVIEHKGNKLHLRLFLLITGAVYLANLLRGRGVAREQSEEVAMEEQAEDADDDDAADAEVAEAEAATASTAVVAPIFDVSADSARCPFHDLQCRRIAVSDADFAPFVGKGRVPVDFSRTGGCFRTRISLRLNMKRRKQSVSWKQMESIGLPLVLLFTGLILIGGDRIGVLSLDRVQNLWPVALILVGLSDFLASGEDTSRTELSVSRVNGDGARHER